MWDRTTILTTTRYKTQLDLTDYAAMKTRDPSLNRTDSAHKYSKLWDPIIPEFACTINDKAQTCQRLLFYDSYSNTC